MSKLNIPINLATEPFRRDRPILVASAAVAGLLTVTLLLMLGIIAREHKSAASERSLVERLTAQATRLSAQQNGLDATLRQPENSVVLERSIFLNSLIHRKAISWTRIFADLEKVMPYNVRLVAVRLPQVDNQNQVLLDMVVGADEAPPVLDFLKRLEKAPQFGPASVLNSIPPSQTDKLWKYRISVSYAQGAAVLQQAAMEVETPVPATEPLATTPKAPVPAPSPVTPKALTPAPLTTTPKALTPAPLTTTPKVIAPAPQTAAPRAPAAEPSAATPKALAPVLPAPAALVPVPAAGPPGTSLLPGAKQVTR